MEILRKIRLTRPNTVLVLLLFILLSSVAANVIQYVNTQQNQKHIQALRADLSIQQTKLQERLSEPEQVSDYTWKYYQNDAHKLSFFYPSSWSLSENESSITISDHERWLHQISVTFNNPYQATIPIASWLAKKEVERQKSLESDGTCHMPGCTAVSGFSKPTTTTIAGKQAVATSHAAGMSEFTTYFIVNKDTIITITEERGSDSMPSQSETALSLILSSFKID